MGLGDYIHARYENYEKYGIAYYKRPPKNKGEAESLFRIQRTNMLSLLARRNKKNNYLMLEQRLNDIFYSKDPTSQEAVNYQQLANTILADLVGQMRFDFNDSKLQDPGVVKWGLGEKVFFKAGTIKNYKQTVEKAIADIAFMINSKQLVDEKKFQNSFNILEQINDKLTLIMEQLSIDSSMDNDKKFYFSQLNKTKKRSAIQGLVKEINELIDGITTLSRYQQIGLATEVGVAMAGDNVKDFSELTALDIIANNLTGTRKDSKITISENHRSTTTGKNFIKKNFVFHQDKVKAKYDFSGKLGSTYKMDVQLSFEDEDYRISAKSYHLKDNTRYIKILDGMPLLNLLMKNMDDPTINTYFNVVAAQGSPDNLLISARKLVRFMILVEGLSGISQQNGYADTLVLNDRFAKKVYVRPIMDLVYAFARNYTLNPERNEINGLSVSNYDEQKLKKGNAWLGSKDQKYWSWDLAGHRITNLLNAAHSLNISASIKPDIIKTL